MLVSTDPGAFLFRCTPVVKNNAVVVETIDDEADTLAITRSKTRAARSEPPEPIPVTKDHLATLVLPPKPAPAYVYKSKAASPEAAKWIHQTILSTTVPHVSIADLLAISSDLRKEAVDYCKTHRIPSTAASLVYGQAESPPVQIEHATPLRELQVMLNGVHRESALLDEGSEIVVIREDV